VSSHSFRRILLDFTVGILAILLILACCFASSRIALDFRLLFALSGTVFFLAGVSRGEGPRLIPQALRISSGSLLGVAVLIVNNGFHRLYMPISLLLLGVLAAACGVDFRSNWRRARRRSFAVLACFILLAGFASLALLPALAANITFVRPAQKTVQFALTVQDRALDSAALRGHVTVLAFYTSWCGACFQELPVVETVYQRFRSDPRVAFYAVDTGWDGETADKGAHALARRHLDLPIAWDSGSASQALGIDALPSIVLLDTNGEVARTHEGFDTSENLESNLTQRINNLLNQGAAAR